MADHVHIRRGVTEDAERLKEIGVTGWETTYAGFVEPENRRRYLNGAFWSVEQLRSVIVDGASIVLVAESGEQTIGFITVEPHEEGEYELTRLYVDPHARSGGVGRRLWEAALDDLRARNVSGVLVNVFGDNRAGRRFYERSGSCSPWRPPLTSDRKPSTTSGIGWRCERFCLNSPANATRAVGEHLVCSRRCFSERTREGTRSLPYIAPGYDRPRID